MRLGRFFNREYAGLFLLAAIALALHLSVIMQPAEPVFDEKFYVEDARYILAGEGSQRIEHPPLGKLLIAAGMFVFGDNPFGWRFFSVASGITATVLFYLICRRLKLSRRASFLAAFILSLENLVFVQSGLAMLDVFSLTFMLASFLLYLKNKPCLAGVAVALAALAKLTGALALPAIAIYWWFSGRQKPRRFALAMAVAPVAFLVLMPLLDAAIWHELANPIERLQTMFYCYNATFADYPSEMLSRPWEWLLRLEIITYWDSPHYLGMLSPSLWLAIIPAMAYAFYRAVKKSAAALFAVAWFTGVYLPWIPFSLITDRLSYVYYFYPAVGAVCLGLAVWAEAVFQRGLTQGKNRVERLGIPLFILAHLAAFMVLAPVSYWWKVPGGVLLYLLARYMLTAPGSSKALTDSG